MGVEFYEYLKASRLLVTYKANNLFRQDPSWRFEIEICIDISDTWKGDHFGPRTLVIDSRCLYNSAAQREEDSEKKSQNPYKHTDRVNK